MIAMCFKLAHDLAVNFAVAERQQTWHVLEQKTLRFKLFEKTQIVLEEFVARVAQEPVRRIDREPLARRPADEDIECAFFQPKPLANLRRSHIFDITRLAPGSRMI